MRILTISNLYPPHFVGGYEIGCHNVMQALQERGHDVTILTSTHGVDRPEQTGQVHRWLTRVTVPSWERRALFAAEWTDQRCLSRLLRRCNPDVIYMWNMGGLPTSLAAIAEASAPVSYYVSDDWLARSPRDRWRLALETWPSGARGRITLSAVRELMRVSDLKPPPSKLQLRRVQFCSAYMRDATIAAGIAVDHSDVVHWGVRLGDFKRPSKTLLPRAKTLAVRRAARAPQRRSHRN